MKLGEKENCEKKKIGMGLDFKSYLGGKRRIKRRQRNERWGEKNKEIK